MAEWRECDQGDNEADTLDAEEEAKKAFLASNKPAWGSNDKQCTDTAAGVAACARARRADAVGVIPRDVRVARTA